MTTHGAIRYAATTSASTLILFIFNLLFFAKQSYILYSDLFQLGQVYQGETHALMYNRYLFTVIAPCSFLIGSALTWLLIARGWVAFVSATLILIVALLAVGFLNLGSIASPPASLHIHTNIQGSEGVDGSSFFDITTADPPRYFLEVRDKNGDIWTEKLQPPAHPKGWREYIPLQDGLNGTHREPQA